GVEGYGDPLPRVEVELGRLDHLEIHLDDLGARPMDGRHLRAALPRFLRQLQTLTPALSVEGRGSLSVGRGGGHLRAPELGKELCRESLELLGFVGGVADGVENEVRAAGLNEALELLRALGGRADDAVLPGEGAEILGVALGEACYPHPLGALVVAAHRDEG